MTITLNQQPIDVAEDITLGSLLDIQGIARTGIAVAVNNKVVRKTDWENFHLGAGDNVLVITAVRGG